MKRLFVKISAFMLALPAATFAQAPGMTYGGFVASIIRLINLAIPVVIGVAIMSFMYGVLKYILSLGNEQEKREGREVMLWGVIALFVMFSVWGILRLLLGTFFGGSGGSFIGVPGYLAPGQEVDIINSQTYQIDSTLNRDFR